MDLGRVDRSILETDRREALPLPPPPLAISSAQPSQLLNRRPCGNCLNVTHRADDFKVHRVNLARHSRYPDSISFAELVLDGSMARPCESPLHFPRLKIAAPDVLLGT